MEDITVTAARANYGRMREVTGAPPVYCQRLSRELLVCGVKGEDFEIQVHNAPNLWDAKAQCVIAWHQHKNEYDATKEERSHQ